MPDGAGWKVRISQGPKGPQVAEVLEVQTQHCSGDEQGWSSFASSLFATARSGSDRGMSRFGKWYNVEKGFGFVAKIVVARMSSFMPRPSIGAD